MYREGKNISGKTTAMKKEQTWKMLSERITKSGITVSRNDKSVGAKISRMLGEYKKTFNFVNNTGKGLMEDGQDITDIMKKMCPYFYVLDPIMGSRASTLPLGLFESEGDATKIGEAGDQDHLLAQSDSVSISSNTITSNLRHAGDGSGTDDVKDVNEAAGARKKRPLTLGKNTQNKTKQHPAVKLLSSLRTAVEKASSQKAEAKALELASRELDLMEQKIEIETKKAELDTKKAEVELNILRLQEKEQLLLTRKRLLDAGVSLEEINCMFPIQ